MCAGITPLTAVTSKLDGSRVGRPADGLQASKPPYSGTYLPASLPPVTAEDPALGVQNHSSP